MSPLRHLVGSGNGMLYYKGPNESLAGGEVGNPTIIRYRFAPPQDSND